MEEEDLLAVEADPLESEPQSDEENIVDSGVFSPEFVATTGVRVYLAACEREGIVPVQQFIVMMDQESVSLKHRGLGAAGGVALFECLRANTCIHALDLEDNQLGLGVDPDSGGLDHISRALADNKLLMLLDLSYNNLSSRGCAAISSALSTSSITDLSLRGNSMGDLGALAFSKALASNRTITKLDVSDNNIDEAGSVALASLLVKCEKLRFADFSWNSIRLAGAQALTTALKESKVVRLNLAWNGLGDRGAKSLAGALAENTELQFLDISKNNLREEAASALAACLAHNSTLRSLQLNGNPLTDRGVGKILQAIGINCSVRDLSLHGVALERSGVGLFDPLNPTGRFTLDLSDPFDRSIFANHLELDRQDEASGIDNFLNVALNGKPLELADGQELSDWKAPAQGTLTYDYVSGKRVPRDARAQRDTVFASFHRELASSLMASDAERLVSLRTACITHFFTCAQAKELLLLFGYTERADAAIILFRRCVDPQHFGLIWDLLSPAERAALQERLDEALTPYLPEEVAVPIFLTEMEVAAQTEANPLEVELETSWQALLPALKAALAAAVTADIGAECDGLRKELGRHYSQLRAVYKCAPPARARAAVCGFAAAGVLRRGRALALLLPVRACCWPALWPSLSPACHCCRCCAHSCLRCTCLAARRAPQVLRGQRRARGGRRLGGALQRLRAAAERARALALLQGVPAHLAPAAALCS